MCVILQGKHSLFAPSFFADVNHGIRHALTLQQPIHALHPICAMQANATGFYSMQAQQACTAWHQSILLCLKAPQHAHALHYVCAMLACRHNRLLQYGIKFWFACSAAMAIILSLSANVPAIATWRPLYLLLTVIIVFSQKVDTTFSKGILRIVASVVGGAYGECMLLVAPHGVCMLVVQVLCIT